MKPTKKSLNFYLVLMSAIMLGVFAANYAYGDEGTTGSLNDDVYNGGESNLWCAGGALSVCGTSNDEPCYFWIKGSKGEIKCWLDRRGFKD